MSKNFYYPLMASMSRNPKYVKGDKREVSLLLAAQRTSQQTKSDDKAFRLALAQYYLSKLSPQLNLKKRTLEIALIQNQLNSLHEIKYTILLAHSQSLQAQSLEIEGETLKQANIIVKRPSIILSILFKNESNKVDGDFGGGGG